VARKEMKAGWDDEKRKTGLIAAAFLAATILFSIFLPYDDCGRFLKFLLTDVTWYGFNVCIIIIIVELAINKIDRLLTTVYIDNLFS
jgi:hypothetical protein